MLYKIATIAFDASNVAAGSGYVVSAPLDAAMISSSADERLTTPALLAFALVGCTPGHAAVPKIEDQSASVAFDAEAYRPLAADVNADGVTDVIVRATTHDAYVALDGVSGRELWRTPPTKENDPDAFAWISGKRLLSAAGRTVNVFDLSTGKLLHSVKLDGSAKRACEAPSGTARVALRDGTVTVDDESDAPSRDAADTPCTELRTDVAKPPKSASVSSTLGEATPDIVPESVLTTELGSIVLGHKRQGPPLPALALVKDGKPVWTAFPAVEKPGSPDRVAIDHGEIALLYDDSTSTRLLSWELTTGKQILDVEVSRRARWVDGDGNGWLVSGSSLAFRVGKTGGPLSPLAGGIEAAEPEWNPGWPVPRGYATKTHAAPNGIEMAIGGAMFGGMMLINVIVYATVDDPRNHWNRQTNWPLLIPGIGPFINMGTDPPEFGTIIALAFDAAIQGTGIIVFSVGAAQKTVNLVPAVRPTAGGATFGVQGSF